MAQPAGALFERLLDLMARLRGPNGCPWDREQTRASLKAYLLEEAYEVLEAIDSGEVAALQEELGDLLFQVVFHARVAEERGEFSMEDLLQRLTEKMVSRHPHVFGDAPIATAAEALRQWEMLKQRESEHNGRRRSVIGGVPRALPSLLRVQRLQTKAAGVNFDWPDARSAWEKVREEMNEVGQVIASGDQERIREELGDVLFSLVNVARLSSINAEDALHAAAEKFRHRFEEMEAALSVQGKSIDSVTRDEIERLWEMVKAEERPR